MWPELECHQNWNVTKTEMLPELKYYKIKKCSQNLDQNQNINPGDWPWSPSSCYSLFVPTHWLVLLIKNNFFCWTQEGPTYSRLFNFFRRSVRSIVSIWFSCVLLGQYTWDPQCFYRFQTPYKTSLLRRLQGRPSPAEAPPIGKIHPFSKMAVTFEPLMGFWCPSGFRKFKITMT